MTASRTAPARPAFLKQLWVWLLAAMVALFATGAVAGTQAMAAAGDTPAHSKTLDSNGDGTYKLELSVTGDADDETQEAGGVNVVVVYDVSQSMTSNAGSSRYSRADQAEDVVHDFLNNLAGYQNTAKDNIRVSLVNFAVTGSQIQGWTTDVSGLANRFDDGGTDGRTNFSYTGMGTNWESALQRAQTLVNGVTNNDPTFVILITDGAPTASGNGNNAIAPTGASIAQLRDRYNAATNEAAAIADAVGPDGTFYGIYAYGTEADLLDDLMYYSENGQHRDGSINNVVAATQDAPNYFNAGETSALQAAIDEIFDKVVQAMGISSAAISDGTTHEVETTSGDIELLEVDEGSYQYWLSIPVVNNKFTRVDRDGNTIEYTVSSDGKTVSWTDGSGTAKSVDVNGALSGGQLKYEWTEANDLYNYEPPAASLNGSSVDWNLSSVGTLLDGVTYSVTFDVWPSQTTLDTVADIKNDPGEGGAWGHLDPAVQQYITVDGKLQTNTTATLTYTDTRTGQNGSAEYTNPDPVQSSAVEQIAVSKQWENELDPDSQTPKPINLKVKRDETEKYTLTLSSENRWTGNVFISIGIMRTGAEGMQILAPGHNFTFTEPDDLSYHWELDVPTVRPMLIDGNLTMLIKVDEKHPLPDGATPYTIDGAQYYAGDTGAASLTATNYRRSSVVLTKAVTGDEAPADAEFPFTLNVVNSNAASGSADKTDSDYYVWLSVRDKENNPVNDAVVSGATAEDGSNGWYYAPSGSDVVINMKAGYKVRLNNLPTGSTYTFTEGELQPGFVFESSELSGGDDPSFEGDRTSTGTVASKNTLYTVTYTNVYELRNIQITKVWDDADDQDGLRPTVDEFKTSLTLKADEEDVTEQYADKLEVTQDPNDENKLVIKWSGLPRFAEAEEGKEPEEIKYTVTESAIDGYTTTGSPAEDGGTITNKHVPEVTEVTVKKVWDDQNDIGKIRPASVNAQLTADGAASGDPVALNDGNEWAHTWENLPKYKDGKEIAYSADETAVPSGYDKTGPEKETAEDGTVTFTVTNTYSPTPVKVDPPVQKVITGNDALYNKGDFTFTIEATSPADAPMPENTEITNSADYELEGKTGFYEFGEITFTVPGTYTYKVTESGKVDGVTNDPDAATGKTLTFTVTDDGKGNLTVDPTTDQVQLSFTNVYDADGEASVVVSKEISGAAWPEGKTLALTIAGTDGAPMPETTTASLDAAGSVTFGPIKYGLADAGKTYTYTITEGSLGAGWSGSPASITATVEVADNGDGTLGTTVTYSPEDATFTNTYKATGKATLKVTKAVEGAEWPSGKKLTLTLYRAMGSDTPLPETTAVELTEAGDATFGPIAYTAADAGKTYTYVIAETEDGFGPGWTGSSPVTATVEVTDNGSGTLATEVTYDPADATITNTYKIEEPGTVTLTAKKVLEGATLAADQFSFTLTGDDGTNQTKTNDASGAVTFDTITYTQPGDYHYTIAEVDGGLPGYTYDLEPRTVTVTVTDNNDGTLTARANPDSAVTFTNAYAADTTVTIVGTKTLVGSDVTELVEAEKEAEDAVTTELEKARDAEVKELTEATAKEKAEDAEKAEADNAAEADAENPEAADASDTADVADGQATDGADQESDDAAQPTDAADADAAENGDAPAGDDAAAAPDGDQVVDPVSDDASNNQSADDPSTPAGDPEADAPAADQAAYDSTDAASTDEGDAASADIQAMADQPDADQAAADQATDFADAIAEALVDAVAPDEASADEAEGENEAGAEGAAAGEGEDAADAETDAAETVETDGSEASADVASDLETPASAPDGSADAAAAAAPADGASDADAAEADPELEAKISEIDAKYDEQLKTQIEELRTQLAADIEDASGTNRPLVEGEFGFTLSYTNTGEEVAYATNDAEGNVSFELSYGLGSTTSTNLAELVDAGIATSETDGSTTTYKIPYTVTENPTGNPAIQVNTDTQHLTVTVVDNGQGELVASVDPEGISFEFVNTYETTVAELPVSGTKVMNGGLELKGGEFSFTITGSDGAPMPAETTVYNDEHQAFDFGTILFTQECFEGMPLPEADEETGEVAPRTVTYTYTVTESGSVPGVVNDPEAATGKSFSVTVTDDGTGVIKLSTDLADNPLKFTNTYETTPVPSSVTDFIPVTKVLTGRDLTEGEFEFVQYDSDGNVVATGTNDASGNVAMGPVTFTEAGAYGYTIKEVNGGTKVGDVTYSNEQYAFVAVVTDNGDGTLSVEWTKVNSEDAVFTNTFIPTIVPAGDVTIKGTKELKGATLTDGRFTFDLKDEAGTVVASVMNKADGSIEFPGLTFKKPGTYTYTVSERNDGQQYVTYDASVKTVTVTVTDPGDGKLMAEVSGGTVAFTNTYTPPQDTPGVVPPVTPIVKTGDSTVSAASIAVAAGIGMALIAGGLATLRRRAKGRA